MRRCIAKEFGQLLGRFRGVLFRREVASRHGMADELVRQLSL
ncbi:hypothetical protein GGD50_006593 [Rhizobium paranaense]|uniref:Uncharacterized protein n=1 Tax=Rhizobium paranaense TaxID=1650438 RepID=A0A7W9D4X4_9HYPH|nr:hypothetical protein [Rhizobium paranaense]